MRSALDLCIVFTWQGRSECVELPEVFFFAGITAKLCLFVCDWQSGLLGTFRYLE